MIPEKLFIPTSTLNFNNIMSSESISPAGFYSKQNFGYKRFEKVDPNNFDNRIILYDLYPIFEIVDSELENFPMVIEVDTRTISEDIIKEQNGYYFADETIYLNPFTTKFIFRRAQEKASTLSKAEPSIETKMVDLYNNCFKYEQRDTNSFHWHKTDIDDSKNDISKYISKDRKINKLKGFLYAYLIGTNKSVSSEMVAVKKNVKHLRNTISAIMASPDGRPSYAQEEQLKNIYKSINDNLQTIFISPILKEKGEEYKCNFEKLLKQENLYDSWLKNNNLKNYFIPRFIIPANNKDKAFGAYMQNLNSQILHYEHGRNKQKIEVSLLPIIKQYRIESIPDQQEFLAKLYNEFLEEAYSSEDFIQSRYEYAKYGGKVFRDYLKEKKKWEGSTSKDYINALLINLNEYRPFDLNSIKSLTLKSFAAFCQKGESDIEKLEEYLISNEIGDSSIALGLWGIIFGFSNMPKTFTNDLLSSKDSDYNIKVYKYIYKQLHSIDLESFARYIKPRDIVSKPSHPEVPPWETIRIRDKSTFTDTPSQPIEEQNIANKLKDCKLKPFQIDDILDLYKKNNLKIDKSLFKAIINSKNKIGKTKISDIKEALGYSASHPDKHKKQDSLSLFEGIESETEKVFYQDPNVFYSIESLIPKQHKEKFKEDVAWFQDEYKKGVSSQYYGKANRSNSAVIGAFKRYIEKKNYSNLLDMDNIFYKLKELYPHNE